MLASSETRKLPSIILLYIDFVSLYDLLLSYFRTRSHVSFPLSTHRRVHTQFSSARVPQQLHTQLHELELAQNEIDAAIDAIDAHVALTKQVPRAKPNEWSDAQNERNACLQIAERVHVELWQCETQGEAMVAELMRASEARALDASTAAAHAQNPIFAVMRILDAHSRALQHSDAQCNALATQVRLHLFSDLQTFCHLNISHFLPSRRIFLSLVRFMILSWCVRPSSWESWDANSGRGTREQLNGPKTVINERRKLMAKENLLQGYSTSPAGALSGSHGAKKDSILTRAPERKEAAG